MNETDLDYRDRMRILLIIYFFAENYNDPSKPDVCKLFQHEVRIQKLDFLIRYPSYLCYELILKIKEDTTVNHQEIKEHILSIFRQHEPEIRTIEMRRFLYGAWEKLDQKLAFLVTHGLLLFDSERNRAGRQFGKAYYLTNLANDKIDQALQDLPSLDWYRQRCGLIKKYFGDLKGTELKALQYNHPEYKDTSINDYIQDIQLKTIDLFKLEFGEDL